MGQRESIKNFKIESPLGTKSIFHNVFADPIGIAYPNDLTNEEDKYTFEIITCESGVEVFEKYNSTTLTPSTRHAYIILEEKDNSKSNFFGTACKVKMGSDFFQLLKKIENKSIQVSVLNNINLAQNLKQFVEDITYFYKGSNKEIESKVLVNAFKLELSNSSSSNKIFQTIFGLNDKLADWMRSGMEEMDTWKFKDENYEFAKFGKDLKPLIPIDLFSKGKDYLFTGKKDKAILKDSGLTQFTSLANSLDEIIFTKAYVIALATPFPQDDLLFATVWLIKEYLEKNIPESIKKIFEKAKAILNQAKEFIKKIGNAIENALAVFNAFLCGLANGLISLLQMVVWLVAFAVDNIPIFEQENFSKEKLAEHQQKLEFIEDLIDTIQINISDIFKGIIANLKTIGTEINAFVKEVGTKLANLSQYFWAFAIGAIAFELILDAVLAFFTGGTSLAASAANKISRLSTQLASKGVKVVKVGLQKAATSASSVFTTVKNIFKEIIEAIKSGKFIEWIKT